VRRLGIVRRSAPSLSQIAANQLESSAQAGRQRVGGLCLAWTRIWCSRVRSLRGARAVGRV